MPNVARGILKHFEKKSSFENKNTYDFKKKFRIFKPMLPPGYPWVFLKKFSQFDSAVWPAIAYIYIYEQDFYYIEFFKYQIEV